MKIDYRLGLDLGTNSIGWCVFRVERVNTQADEAERWRIQSIQRAGARIFSDSRNPKDQTSLAAARRDARQARRRRDRALKRKGRLLKQLVEFGLLPENAVERKALVSLDPYTLRAKGIKEALPLAHFGRALFHLARKRGFRSGRKDFQSEQSKQEAGKIQSGIDSLKARLEGAGCETVGEYLAQLHVKGQPVLARPGIDGNYPIYLGRELVADEFDRLWAVQSRHHAQVLTESKRTQLRETLLFQRKLRPVEPGKCLFERTELRALLAHPLSQRFRILQELANLRIQLSAIEERKLSKAERDVLLEALTTGRVKSKGKMSWSELRTVLGLPKTTSFNLDINGRKGIDADNTSAKLNADAALGADWKAWSPEEQGRFLRALRQANRLSDLAELLAEWQLSKEQHAALFNVLARMPDEFSNLSIAALKRIVPALESDVIAYSDAVKLAGYAHHSMFYDGEQLQKLPYYGERLQAYTQPRDLPGASPDEREYGRITNPTVHVGLNQLRKIVNALIRRYGHPRQIIVEVARDLGLSGENRRKLQKVQAENADRNIRLGEQLVSMGIPNVREHRQRLQLYEELCKGDALGAECVYSGERIGIQRLFSAEVEIDHILPFSRALDDGMGNKLLCTRRANRDKGQRTPFEAFGHSPGSYRWDQILERAERLLRTSGRSVSRKAQRFGQNAMEDFLQDEDFLARHLNDTAYFSKVAREYLTSICPPNCVWASSGRLTSMLRGKWGLNRILSSNDRKTRTDHRHHAVDAAVIGACDRSVIKSIADSAARAEVSGESRLLEHLIPPWPSFFDEVEKVVGRIVVSHKVDRDPNQSMHDEMPFGVRGRNPDGSWIAVKRMAVVDISPDQTQEDGKSRVFDAHLRGQLRRALEGAATKVECISRLQAWSHSAGIRRVRVMASRSLVELPNPARSQGRFVATQGNACFEIFRNEAGGKWQAHVTSYLEAIRIQARSPGVLDQWKVSLHGAPLVMRIFKGDTLAIESNNALNLYVVVELRAGNKDIGLVPVAAAGAKPARTYHGLSRLQMQKARVVKVDELGYVNDPGFRE